VYHYKLAYDGDYIDAAEQFSVRWDDPSIAIDWPVTEPVLSGRDLKAPFV
jgi:dTDP-4-dehydrorhamnose 3,5-epimerase